MPNLIVKIQQEPQKGWKQLDASWPIRGQIENLKRRKIVLHVPNWWLLKETIGILCWAQNWGFQKVQITKASCRETK